MNSDLAAGNTQSATTVLYDNTSSFIDASVTADTSELAIGLTNLQTAGAAAVVAVGQGVAAALNAESGNIAAAIGNAATALGAAITTYNSITDPSTQEALHDLGDSMNDWLGFDPDWAAMFSDAIHAGVPGAAVAYSQTTHNADLPHINALHLH